MIIRGVVLFLKIVEFVWDIIDKVKLVGVKSNKHSSMTDKAFKEAKPSYSQINTYAKGA